MDQSAELTQLVFSRVQKMDPDNASKIVGCILLREPSQDELMRLAYGPDAPVVATIMEARSTLAAIYARCSSLHYPVRHFSPAAFSFHLHHQPPQCWPDSPPPEKADHQLDGYYYAEDAARAGRRASGRRPCHYFLKGMCKNGQHCHYSHSACADGLHGGTTPGSLERLEVEITELLHARHGQPVSIASLPTLFSEKYGKGLQADGYLTESQRHGKAGYSLTKLLSRLNKIRVIERPHGQHAVVLAEDVDRYSDFRGGGEMPASSHQIYLTFPSDSTFTEDDVASYFGQYGPVRDVRIPCQDQRMFGFVSFQNPETVATLLMRRSPHFICGSRVLAKPYREKSKCINDRTKPMMQYYPPRWFEADQEFYPSEFESPRLTRKHHLAEKRERLIELERRRLAGIRIEPLPPQFAYFDCSIGDVSPFNSNSAGSKELGLMDTLVAPDPVEVVSTSQGPPTQASNYDDQESNQIELPESPFASSAPDGNGVSAII